MFFVVLHYIKNIILYKYICKCNYQKERENGLQRRREPEKGIPVNKMREVYEEKRMKTRRVTPGHQRQDKR